MPLANLKRQSYAEFMDERIKIKAFCNAVAKQFRPRKIILFGSYAYGKPTEDSDVDLLVVMNRTRYRGERMAVRIRQTVPIQRRHGWRFASGWNCWSTEKIIVESRRMPFIKSPMKHNLLNELRGTGIRLGYLINFGRERVEYKRLVF